MAKEDAEVVELEPEEEVAEKDAEEPLPAGTPVASVPRRTPGQKEVIPFAWKVCGYSSDGYTLTLFKSVERADADAQLARLVAEGYYGGLAIYPIDDKVPTSPLAKKLTAQRVKQEKQAALAARKAARRGRSKAAGSAKSKKTSTAKRSTVTAKRKASAKKAAVATKKTKTAKRASTAKKTAARATKKTVTQKKVAAKKARSRKKK